MKLVNRVTDLMQLRKAADKVDYLEILFVPRLRVRRPWA